MNGFFSPLNALERGIQVISSLTAGLLISILTQSNEDDWNNGVAAAATIFVWFELSIRWGHKKTEEKKQQQAALCKTKLEEAINDLLVADPESENPWPISVICPLTKRHIHDPVQTLDGNLYERNAILKWIEQNRIQLVSNQLLLKHNLLECPELKEQLAVHETKVAKAHLSQFNATLF